jgi:hypothetical protein
MRVSLYEHVTSCVRGLYTFDASICTALQLVFVSDGKVATPISLPYSYT